MRVVLTHHARERAADMGFTEAEVAEAVRAPRMSYPSRGRRRETGDYGELATTSVDRDARFAAIWVPQEDRFAPGEEVALVTTVVWRRFDQYDRAQTG